MRAARAGAARAQGAGYALVIGNADERSDKEASYLELFVAERVAGVVLSTASEQHADDLRKQGIPLVVVDRAFPGDSVDTVLADSEGGAFKATSHMLGQGFRRIACITGPADRPTAVDRLRGYLRAHAEAGLKVDEALIRHSDFRQQGGYAAAYDLLTGSPVPDAMFVCQLLLRRVQGDQAPPRRVVLLVELRVRASSLRPTILRDRDDAAISVAGR